MKNGDLSRINKIKTDIWEIKYLKLRIKQERLVNSKADQ